MRRPVKALVANRVTKAVAAASVIAVLAGSDAVPWYPSVVKRVYALAQCHAVAKMVPRAAQEIDFFVVSYGKSVETTRMYECRTGRWFTPARKGRSEIGFAFDICTSDDDLSECSTLMGAAAMCYNRDNWPKADPAVFINSPRWWIAQMWQRPMELVRQRELLVHEVVGHCGVEWLPGFERQLALVVELAKQLRISQGTPGTDTPRYLRIDLYTDEGEPPREWLEGLIQRDATWWELRDRGTILEWGWYTRVEESVSIQLERLVELPLSKELCDRTARGEDAQELESETDRLISMAGHLAGCVWAGHLGKNDMIAAWDTYFGPRIPPATGMAGRMRVPPALP